MKKKIRKIEKKTGKKGKEKFQYCCELSIVTSKLGKATV